MSDEEYEVEEIRGKCWKQGIVYYQVHWKGWPDSSDTWEPEEHLNCSELIETFEKRIVKPVPKSVSGKKKSRKKSVQKPKVLIVAINSPLASLSQKQEILDLTATPEVPKKKKRKRNTTSMASRKRSVRNGKKSKEKKTDKSKSAASSSPMKIIDISQEIELAKKYDPQRQVELFDDIVITTILSMLPSVSELASAIRINKRWNTLKRKVQRSNFTLTRLLPNKEKLVSDDVYNLCRFLSNWSKTDGFVLKLVFADTSSKKATVDLDLDEKALKELLRIVSPKLELLDVRGCQALCTPRPHNGDPAIILLLRQHFNRSKKIIPDGGKKPEIQTLKFRVAGCRLNAKVDKSIHGLCHDWKEVISVMVHQSDVCATEKCDSFVWSELPCSNCEKRYCHACNEVVESPCQCCVTGKSGLCRKCSNGRLRMCACDCPSCPRLPYECSTCNWKDSEAINWSICAQCKCLRCNLCRPKNWFLCGKCGLLLCNSPTCKPDSQESSQNSKFECKTCGLSLCYSCHSSNPTLCKCS